MKRIILLLLLVSFLAPSIARAQASAAQTRQKAIDEYVQSQMELIQIPGLSLGIVEDGEITYLKGYGTADGSGAPVTPDTPFAVGSVGKSFTALCIRQLVNAGRIDYNAPVQTYIPWFTLFDQEAAAKIKIIDLLNHQSGLSNADGNMPWSYNSGYTIEETVRRMRMLPAKHLAGSFTEYCNLNFILLGLVVEQVSGMPYGQYLQENVFGPLHMKNSYPSMTEAQSARPAQGHCVAYGQALPNYMPVPTGQVPAGFQYSCARDMAAYAALLLNNGYRDGKPIFAYNELPELSPPFSKPGYTDRRYSVYWGIESGRVPGNGYHGHSGASSGFTSALLVNNMKRRAIVVLSNCRDTYAEPEIMAIDIGNGIASILDTGKTPGLQAAKHPDLTGNLLILAAALLLPLIRLVWAARFAKAVQKGGWRRRMTLVSFALFDVLLPAAILTGLPLYYDNTWPYFLAASPEITLPLFAAAALLAAAGIIKTILLGKGKKPLAA